MQTFLPYPGFDDTARVLDARRLGKQRVEVIQVLRALTVPGYGWRHHPAAAMWAGYEEAPEPSVGAGPQGSRPLSALLPRRAR